MILQVVVAAVFFTAGLLKVVRSKEMLSQGMEWARAVPALQIKLIGLLELVASIALVLPAFFGSGQFAVLASASCLTLLMVMAGVFHFKRKEFKSVSINLGLLVLCLLIVADWFS